MAVISINKTKEEQSNVPFNLTPYDTSRIN